MQDEKINKEKTIEELNAIADKVVDGFFAVHRHLGPGFNEAIYDSKPDGRIQDAKSKRKTAS